MKKHYAIMTAVLLAGGCAQIPTTTDGTYIRDLPRIDRAVTAEANSVFSKGNQKCLEGVVDTFGNIHAAGLFIDYVIGPDQIIVHLKYRGSPHEKALLLKEKSHRLAACGNLDVDEFQRIYDSIPESNAVKSDMEHLLTEKWSKFKDLSDANKAEERMGMAFLYLVTGKEIWPKLTDFFYAQLDPEAFESFRERLLKDLSKSK